MKTVSKTLKTSEVVHLTSENYRVDYEYGDSKDIILSMQAKGWDPAEPLLVEPIGDHLEAAMDYLKNTLAVLKDRVLNPVAGEKSVNVIDPTSKVKDPEKEEEEVSTSHVFEAVEMHAAALKAFQAAHCNSKGTIIKPKYLVIDGHRRLSAWYKAKRNEIVLGYEDVDFMIPSVASEEKLSKMERDLAQGQSNNRKGKKKPSLVSDLHWTRRMVQEHGCKQSAIRDTLGTRGVQTYFLVVICLFEEKQGWGLKLWEQLTAPVKDSKGKITYKLNASKFDHKTLQGGTNKKFMGPRCDLGPRFKASQKRIEAATGEPCKRPTKDELSDFMVEVNTGVKQSKRMSVTRQDTLAASTPNRVVEVFNEMIETNDETQYSRLVARAQGCNYALECSDEEYAELIELIESKTLV